MTVIKTIIVHSIRQEHRIHKKKQKALKRSDDYHIEHIKPADCTAKFTCCYYTGKFACVVSVVIVYMVIV